MADPRPLVAAALATFNRRDIEAALELMHPDVVWSHEHLSRVPEPIAYRGPSEVRRFWESYLESFERFDLRVDEIHSGEDWVACSTVIVGVGKGSHAEVEAPPLVYVYEVEDDLIKRVTAYPEMEDALAAFGERS